MDANLRRRHTKRDAARQAAERERQQRVAAILAEAEAEHQARLLADGEAEADDDDGAAHPQRENSELPSLRNFSKRGRSTPSFRNFSQTLASAIGSSRTVGRSGEDVRASVVTVEDVVSWIGRIGYPEYAQRFQDNEVDGRTLTTISNEELRLDLGIRNPKHRREILDRLKDPDLHAEQWNTQPLPGMGRMLCLLSNVRTYQSWTLVGVQLCIVCTGFLRKGIRPLSLVGIGASIIAVFAVCVLGYASLSYRKVISLLQKSNMQTRLVKADFWSLFALAGIQMCVFVLYLAGDIWVAVNG